MIILKNIPKLVVLLAVFYSVQRCMFVVQREVEVAVIQAEDPIDLVNVNQNVAGINFAIKEINASGGINGYLIRPIMHSFVRHDFSLVENLDPIFKERKYKAVFGCWTPLCRRTLPKHKENVLFYSGLNEGMDEYKNTVAISPLPNQQVLPALEWMTKKFGNKIYLVGSERVYSEAVSMVLHRYAKEKGLEIVGEKKIRPEMEIKDKDFLSLVGEIIEEEPDIVVNLLVGDNNTMLFKGLHALLPTGSAIKILSFNLDENLIESIGSNEVADVYVSSNFFEHQSSELLKKVRESFSDFSYGLNHIGAPFVNGYNSVYVWKKLVEKAESFDSQNIMGQVLQDQKTELETSFSKLTFEGKAPIPSQNVYIGHIGNNGKLKTIWKSSRPIAPVPYPHYLTPKEWNNRLRKLYKKWGNWIKQKRS